MYDIIQMEAQVVGFRGWRYKEGEMMTEKCEGWGIVQYQVKGGDGC